MDTLRNLFPFSFTEKKDVKAVVVNVILHIVAGWIAGIVIGIAGLIPVIGLLAPLAASLVEVYLLAGMIISVLDYCNVLK